MAVTTNEGYSLAMKAYESKMFPAGRPLWPPEYQEETFESAWRFVTICRTWNEAAKEVQPFPDRKYLRLMTRLWLKQKLKGKALWVEKCRRMVVSWLFRCLELWQMGRNRCDVMIVGENFGSAAKHIWRLGHLYEDLRSRMNGQFAEDWALPPADHLQHQGDRSYKQFSLSNGSIASAANGDDKKVQGEGVAIITLEEMGTYSSLKAIIGQAQIITKAEAGTIGGFVCGVTNTTTKSEWQDIKAVYNRPGVKFGLPLPGFKQVDHEDESIYCHVQYFADPAKDTKWLAEVAEEMKHTPRTYRREILMDDTVVEGDPVWEEYVSAEHEYHGDPRTMLNCDGKLFGFWDCGTARMPAFLLGKWTAQSRQIRWIMEILPLGPDGQPKPMAMATFAPIVATRLKAVLPGEWSTLEHFGDETVKTLSGASEESAYDVARKSGFDIRPVSNRWAGEGRREASTIFMLTDYCDDDKKKPRMVFSVIGCPVLVKGMRGAYCTERKKSVDTSGPGMEVIKPKKNFYSHINDAMQVGAVVIMREMRAAGIIKSAKRM